MNPHVSEWLNLILRWTHVITGIAWIGTSFYFNWLDSRLTDPETPRRGVAGELWAVHSGGFYRVQKYEVAPERLPRTLHWFKWEAYFTWLTGIALLVLIYYMDSAIYLLDPSVSGIGTGAAIGLGIGTLVVSWFVYDLMCKSRLGNSNVLLGASSFLLVVGVAFGLTSALSSRAAYMHVGAMLGTLMAANVFRVIIPSQRMLVAATREGRQPKAVLGERAKQRSLHNNYMTLPVLFIMVSGHYPTTYGHAFNWLILAALVLVGAGVRHYFNLRNRGQHAVWILPAAVLAMVVLAFVTAPSAPISRSLGTSASDHIPFSAARAVILERCVPCHSATPTLAGLRVPPLGIAFDTPEQIQALAARIYVLAVTSQTMPTGNLTAMTQDERDLLGRWIAEGATTQ